MFGTSPSHNLISFGNQTFDNFLGGGLLNSSLNIFERQGPSSRVLESVWNKSFASRTLSSKYNLIIVNFNPANDIDSERFISTLPSPRRVNSEVLYKDIRAKSQLAKIKIAWRYTNKNSSPSNSTQTCNQIDFGLSLGKESRSDELGRYKIINVPSTENFNLPEFLIELERNINELKEGNKTVNILIKDLFQPFSPLDDKPVISIKFLYSLRCLSRSLVKGAILITYDSDLIPNYDRIRQQIYNIADCLVNFASYETGQNKISGYKNIDGTLDYVKVPKINSFGLHFQQELSDWGYRFTKNHKFFVVDELSLPPCGDDDQDPNNKQRKQNATDITNIEHSQKPLERVGPLEEFREIAGDVLARQL